MIVGELNKHDAKQQRKSCVSLQDVKKIYNKEVQARRRSSMKNELKSNNISHELLSDWCLSSLHTKGNCSSENFSSELQSCVEVEKKVRFSVVEIREYPMIVGDNPGGSQGPPITISWTSVSSFTIQVDEFQNSRLGQRRKHLELIIPLYQRKEILKRQGFRRKR